MRECAGREAADTAVEHEHVKFSHRSNRHYAGCRTLTKWLSRFAPDFRPFASSFAGAGPATRKRPQSRSAVAVESDALDPELAFGNAQMTALMALVAVEQ